MDSLETDMHGKNFPRGEGPQSFYQSLNNCLSWCRSQINSMKDPHGYHMHRVKALSYFAARYRAAPVILFILKSGAGWERAKSETKEAAPCGTSRRIQTIQNYVIAFGRINKVMLHDLGKEILVEALKKSREFETAKTAVVAKSVLPVPDRIMLMDNDLIVTPSGPAFKLLET
uniref:Uncharacterized protein n=1 Tax=Romanomermis culicivorax TaxID=13658 RepID=A0A915HK50_ROMCU